MGVTGFGGAPIFPTYLIGQIGSPLQQATGY